MVGVCCAGLTVTLRRLGEEPSRNHQTMPAPTIRQNASAPMAIPCLALGLRPWGTTGSGTIGVLGRWVIVMRVGPTNLTMSGGRRCRTMSLVHLRLAVFLTIKIEKVPLRLPAEMLAQLGGQD